jgi:hypothetical protein
MLVCFGGKIEAETVLQEYVDAMFLSFSNIAK